MKIKQKRNKSQYFENIKKIWINSIIFSDGKIIILLLLILTAAALEAAAAGMVLPFVAIISSVDYIASNLFLEKIFTFFNFANKHDFQIALTIFLLVFIIFKNLFLALVTKFQYKLIFKGMYLTSTRMFASYLAKPYEFHIKTNSSVMIRNVSNEVQMFYTNVFASMLLVFGEISVVFAIAGLLLWIAPIPTLITIIILILSTLIIDKFIRSKVRRYGEQQQYDNAMRIKCINHGLGGIKEIKVMGRESYFIDSFAKYERSFAESMRHAMVLNHIPRLFIETISYSTLFLAVLMALLLGSKTTELLPTLALFAVAAVRLMPSLNRIQSGINRINYYWASASVVCADVYDGKSIGKYECNNADIPFVKDIIIKDVNYTYPGASKPSISSVNLLIPKGTSVAITGASGAGKTTLVDIILGLIKPDSGKIIVDGVDISTNIAAWRERLGYVPQNIFLSDDTIRRNVAFGVMDEAIDDKKIWDALEYANLKSYIKGLEKGLDTIVGERGVNMSGGQRQRLGIARALYKNPEILVLDEATSALDTDTEKDVSRAINSFSGQKTLIIIAHRLSTIEKCNVHLELRNIDSINK